MSPLASRFTTTRRRTIAGAIAAAVLFGAPAAAAPARPAPVAVDADAPIEVRERAASTAFRAGRHGEALALYQALWSETKHPIYLRNIARCHQMRREPDEAIDHFERYLAARPDVTAQERREVRIYIGEMEQLRQLLAAEGASPRPAVAPPAAAFTTAPAAPAPSAADVALAATPAPAPPRPLYRNPWLWGAVAAAAAGAVTVFFVTREGRMECPAAVRLGCK